MSYTAEITDNVELYSIIYTLSTLERIFMQGSLNTDQKSEYASLCNELLDQYHSLISTMDKTDPLSVLKFADKDDINFFKLALRRITAGINGCTEHTRQQQTATTTAIVTDTTTTTETNTITSESPTLTKVSATNLSSTPSHSNLSVGNEIHSADKKTIAEATASFITLLDAVKLGYNTRDALHPLLADTLKKAGKVIVNNDFPGRSSLVQWLIRINKMSVIETIEEEDLKNLLCDVDTAYSGFFGQL